MIDSILQDTLITPRQDRAPSQEQTDLKVHDIMSVEKVRVFENDNIRNALDIMFWEDLFHVCVFNENHDLVGILHFSDAKSAEDKTIAVKEVMNTKFEKIYGGVSAELGKKAVVQNKDHSMPVFEKKKIIGILNIENIHEYSQYLGSDIEKLYA